MLEKPYQTMNVPYMVKIWSGMYYDGSQVGGRPEFWKEGTEK
jgi:hypothetical protein